MDPKPRVIREAVESGLSPSAKKNFAETVRQYNQSHISSSPVDSGLPYHSPEILN
jgi:hypothetical protein